MADEDSDIKILEYACESMPADGEDDNEVTRWTGIFLTIVITPFQPFKQTCQ